jgi:hypothetical protein
MTMPVTDEQEATLHTMLAGKFDEYERMLDELDPVAARTGYSALVSAAFCIAASERFPEGTPAEDVIEYVGDVRSRTEGTAKMDPVIAERLLLAVFTDEQTRDIDRRTSYQTQLVLLTALMADARPDEDQLSDFMIQARGLADQWLA